MGKRISISIIIPVFNAQDWMRPTIEHLLKALAPTKLQAEIVVVDDGSTDATLERLKEIQAQSKDVPIVIVAQENKGRYLARKTGIDKAKHELIMFIDSRVFLDENALVYLEEKLQSDPLQVWNSHVNVDKKGNPLARFWDAIVCIAWRRYFANPRETSYGLKDFDYFPKGTTCFFVPKQLFIDALDDYEKHNVASKFSNDDTALIRYMAARQPIHISPQFSCVYHARSTFKGFLKHAYHRGQVFTDGFLKPNNRFFVPLLVFLFLTLCALVALVAVPLTMLALIGAAVLGGMCALFLGAILLRVDWRDAVVLAGLSPLFALVYGSGIWRGVFRKLGRQ